MCCERNVDMAALLANSCLFIDQAVTEQHYYSFGVVFLDFLNTVFGFYQFPRKCLAFYMRGAHRRHDTLTAKCSVVSPTPSTSILGVMLDDKQRHCWHHSYNPKLFAYCAAIAYTPVHWLHCAIASRLASLSLWKGPIPFNNGRRLPHWHKNSRNSEYTTAQKSSFCIS